MAHYAFINEDNVVVEVIVGKDETEPLKGFDTWEDFYSARRGLRCIRTSYNGNIRKNYAGVGMIYDEERDAFRQESPFPSWVLNEETCLWEAPVPYPTDGRYYYWDEAVEDWAPVSDEPETTE